MDEAFRTAHIYVRDTFAGTLQETDAGYVFAYDTAYLADEQSPAVSLTLPKRQEPYVLSDAYDLLPVNVILPEDKEQFALTMNGKKRNLCRKDFMLYAQNCGITEKTADRLIQSVVDRLNGYIELCRASLLPGDMKEKLEALMIERCDILSRQ